MNLGNIVKINILLLALGVVIYSIYALNTRGLPDPVVQLMGLNPPSDRADHEVKLCGPGLAAIIRPNEYKIEKIDSDWMVEMAGAVHKADQVEVEKWLAVFCNIPAQKKLVAEDDTFKPALMLKYVDGSVEMVKQSLPEVFSFQGMVVRAPLIEQAIEGLMTLTGGHTAPAQGSPNNEPVDIK